MDHPAIGVIPSLIFLAVIIFVRQLVQQPYVDYLPGAGGFCLLISVIHMIQVGRRLNRTKAMHTSRYDMENYYGNAHIPTVERILLLQKRTGCFTLATSFLWFFLALIFWGLWAFPEYLLKQ
jgi:hypothetical protein